MQCLESKRGVFFSNLKLYGVSSLRVYILDTPLFNLLHQDIILLGDGRVY